MLQRVAGQVDVGRARSQGEVVEGESRQGFDQIDIGQRHVARIGKDDAVVDLVAHRIGDTVAVATGDIKEQLAEEHHRAHKQLHRLGIEGRAGLVGDSHSVVIESAVAAAVGVEVRLLQRVAGQVFEALTWQQSRQGVAECGEAAAGGDVVQGRRANVTDDDAVVENVARCIGQHIAIAAGQVDEGFDDLQAGGPQQLYRFGIADGIGLVAVGRRGVLDGPIATAVGVKVGLGEHVTRSEGLKLARGQGQPGLVEAGERIDH